MTWFSSFRRKPTSTHKPEHSGELEAAKARIAAAREALEELKVLRLRAIDAAERMRTKYHDRYWAVEGQMFVNVRLSRVIPRAENTLNSISATLELEEDEGASRATAIHLRQFFNKLRELEIPLVALIEHEEELDREAETVPELRVRTSRLVEQLMERRSHVLNAELERQDDEAIKLGQDTLAAAEVELTRTNPDHVALARRLQRVAGTMGRVLYIPVLAMKFEGAINAE